jgi:dTDP-4-amino-4,6-dideoxygalactose transaminase
MTVPTGYRNSGPGITMSDADIGDREIALVTDILRQRQLSGGPIVDRFEREFAECIGARHAVAVSSGTAALHLALIAAGVVDGDVVVTTPYSFVASANAVLYQRAIPLFVDVDPVTCNIDPAQVEHALDDLSAGGAAARRWLPRTGADAPHRVRAVLPVHVFGRPAAMEPLRSSARAHGVAIVEDACEAIGAGQGGVAAGCFGDAAAFGFFPNKQLTTGEGGVVVTPHDEWAALLRSLRNHGREGDDGRPEYPRLGYNYRLDGMSAALGLAQLRRLDELLDKRARVAAAYHERLAIDGVQPMRMVGGSWFVFVVRLAPAIDRDRVMRELAQDGIPSRAYFPCIHLQAFYRDRFGYRPGDFPIAEAASRETLALPFHAGLSDDAIDCVVSSLAAAVERARR